MKRTIPIRSAALGLWAAGLLAATVVSAAWAATPALNGRVELRPVTPSNLKDYSLGSAQQASGLSTIAVGEPAYLEAEINLAIPASNIVSVTWALTSQPVGSAATLAPSPLGSNVPVYRPADQLIYQIAGRTMLRPDVRGQYTVVATITTASYGTTNVTQTITAGTWMGVATCELCHSGGLIAPDMYHLWTNTLHSSKFTRGINGQIAGYGKGCISCHTVGYDVNTNAVNGGFDDLAAQLGWTFPTNLVNTNFASMPAALQNLANIQCENCHGPGSEHAYSLGDTNRISVSWNPGDCGQCHDSKTHHINNPEWANSRHAVTTRTPSGAGRENCVGCHTSMGFAGRMSGSTVTNTAYEAIGCATCHDPHDATNPHQLRNVGPVVLGDGSTVSGYGPAELCMNCHHSRNGAATNNVVNYPLGLPTWRGGSSFGPHDGPQTDMFMGRNGFDYGLNIPSSAHRDALTNACVTCHMQPSPAPSDPGFLLVGGHTFSVSYSNGSTNIEMTTACTQCHGPIKTFDFPREDYNGDGIIEGVQTEVQHLLDQLSTLLPPNNLVKTSLSVKTNWTPAQLKAAYNWQFVNNDGSHGVHNVAYAVGLLKASIADLTPDNNHDGLPDAWQVQYFGSVTNANAAPTATPAGDGVPNWLKYTLGLNPLQAGMSVPGGVVWANGKTLGNASATNTVQIYNAAEVAFNSELGKTYQLQAISSLGGGWTNVGSPIAGTGAAISYVTPTRANVQQYYRVVTLP